MKKISIVIMLLSFSIFGQFIPNTSVTVSDDASGLVINPAGLGVSRGFNMLFLSPLDFTKLDSTQEDFGVYFQAGRTGFGFTYLKEDPDLFHWGSGEHFWKGIYLGSTTHFSSDGYEKIDLGMMYRGFSWISSGLSWKNLWSRERKGVRLPQEFGLGIAFRPFGNRMTIAYDHRLSFDAETFFENVTDLGGVLQINTEPIDGIKLFTSYNTKDNGIQIGIGIGFAEASMETYHNLDEDNQYGSSLVGFHVSQEIRRSIIPKKASTFVEMAFDTPITDSPTPKVFFGPKTITLRDLIQKIRDMTDNPTIDGIILKPDNYHSGMGMMDELIQAFRYFKQSGKKIYAFMDSGSDVSYALACVADSIYLNRGGFLAVDGLALGVGFLKGLFDKIGVEAQFYRRGDYKTAAEPFTREHLTETSREAYEAVLNDLHTIFSEMILKGRNWTPEKLNEVYAKALYTPPMALETGLIDGIFHPDQIETKMKEIAGEKVKIKKVNKLPRQWVYDWEPVIGPKIALIYAEGPIYPGKSEPSPFGGDKIIGSETTAGAIQAAREDKSVKAIVMRVNSPGGSVLASEDIWREVHRTTHPDSADEENQKPFIISMANVAGSGGYYISCAADTIVADSACITGSIGVLSGKISLGGLFKKIGYNVDIIKETPHAEQFGMHRTFTEEEGQQMQAIVDSYYEQFLDRVSEGRGMTIEEVDAVAQGRIWSGIDAKEKGLVDILGGLDTAIEVARKKANLEEDKYDLQIYKGVEPLSFEFNLKTKSELMKILEMFETDVPITKMLDRAKLINDERFLYLMEEELILEE